jgi:acyl-CoA dehydrogenase
MPFGAMVMEALTMGLVDGPTEVHKTTLARQLVKGYEASPGLFPTGHLPTLADAARVRYADALAGIGER